MKFKKNKRKNLALTAHKGVALRGRGILAFTRSENIKTRWNRTEQEKQDLRQQFGKASPEGAMTQETTEK